VSGIVRPAVVTHSADDLRYAEWFELINEKGVHPLLMADMKELW
jgi:hypothetical protein